MASRYRIRDWNNLYEQSRSGRTLRNMAWVPLRTNLLNAEYLDLIDHPDGALHFAAWISLLQIAALQPIRGEFAADRSGMPRFAARLSRLPAKIFEDALPRLVKLGWVEEIQQHADICAEPQRNVAEPQRTAAECCPTIQDNTVQDSTQHNRGDIPIPTLNSDSWDDVLFRAAFKKLWVDSRLATRIELGATEATTTCAMSPDPVARSQACLTDASRWIAYYRHKGLTRNVFDWVRQDWGNDPPEIRSKTPEWRNEETPRMVSNGEYAPLTEDEIVAWEKERGLRQ